MAERDYEIGYGKPPKHSQFQKGTSGFAGQKHKAKRSASDLLDAILDERIEVSEGGKKAKMTKLEVFLRQIMSAAMSGDRHARKMVLDYVNRRQSERAIRGDSTTDDFLIAQLTSMLRTTPSEGEDSGEA